MELCSQQPAASSANGQPVSAGRGPVTRICGNPRVRWHAVWYHSRFYYDSMAHSTAQHETTCEVVDRYPKSGTRSKRQARE